MLGEGSRVPEMVSAVAFESFLKRKCLQERGVLGLRSLLWEWIDGRSERAKSAGKDLKPFFLEDSPVVNRIEDLFVCRQFGAGVPATCNRPDFRGE